MELMVVVVIISILAALLLPSLRDARESAKRIACMSNLRQVGQALTLYGSENEGWINGTGKPDVWADSSSSLFGDSGTTSRLTNFMQRMTPLVLQNQSVGYGSSGCPSMSKTDPNYPFGVNIIFSGDYGVFNPTNWPMHSLNDVVDGGRILLVSEAELGHVEDPSQLDSTCSGRSSGFPRHMSRGLNLVFVDGHGRFIKAAGNLLNDHSSEWWTTAGPKRWAPYNNGSYPTWGMFAE